MSTLGAPGPALLQKEDRPGTVAPDLPLASQVPPARVVYTAGVEKMRTPGWGPVHRQAEGLHPGNGLIAKVHGTATRIVLMHVKISEAD